MSRRGKLCGGAKLWTSLKLASPSVYTEMSGVFVIKRIRSLCILWIYLSKKTLLLLYFFLVHEIDKIKPPENFVESDLPDTWRR